MYKITTQFATIITILFFMSCSSDNVENNQDPFLENAIEQKDSYTELEYEVVSVINEYRSSINLPPLSILNSVSGAAQSHSKYMASHKNMNHDNFNARSNYLMENENAQIILENVAYGYNTAQDVVNAWIRSASHKTNILNPSVTHFGLSIQKDNRGRKYYTNIFIKK